MASKGKRGSERSTGPGSRGAPQGGDGRVLVDVGGARRPFMRGIMVHSLMERGVPFDEAYRTAEQVRQAVRGRAVISREELARLVAEILGDEAVGELARPATAAPHVRVTTPGRETPFSKGLLSQSLLAASLAPDDAFDVAREIEEELLRRGKLVVDRRELRRLTYERLCQRFGETAAQRYLVWRHYQDPERPVILLMGGTTGAGKTSLALEVARRLGIGRVLSTDSIRQIMRLMLSEELMPSIHVSSFDAHRHLPTAGSGGDDAVIEGFTDQASLVSVGVRAMMDRAIAEQTSLVLDGVTLVPGLIDLDHYADSAHVIDLVIATLDEEAFAGRFEARAGRQQRRGKHRYLENLEAILEIQNHFLELADQFDVPIVDNVSVESSVQLIIRHVVETLRKKDEFKAKDLL